MNHKIFLIIFLVFWAVFAVIKEKSDHHHPYSAAQTLDKDSVMISIRKIRYCMTYELRAVKWRRSLLSAAIATILLFAVCWQRIPTSQEIITHLLLITVVFSIVWSNFSTRTATDALRYCDGNINHVKKMLKSDRNFILPSW